MPLRPSFPVASTRLLLRPLDDDDVAGVLSYRSRPDVCRWVPFEPMDADAVAARIRGPFARRSIEAEGDALLLGAEVAADGVLAGDLMLHWSSAEHQSGEVGYVFHPDLGGRGYATEAVHTLLHLAFDDLGLHRVIARVDARNTSSARLALRVGMRQEAHLLENEWFKGGWSDELDFAMLRREWAELHVDGCPMGYRPAPSPSTGSLPGRPAAAP